VAEFRALILDTSPANFQRLQVSSRGKRKSTLLSDLCEHDNPYIEDSSEIIQ